MSPASVNELLASHEIVELTEKCDSKISSINDDIDKLFEAVGIGSCCRGVGGPERNFRDALVKSAMKRPMRAIPQVPGIEISGPMSLKQALRRLCISQASEMAAVKKRMSRPSASPGISEAGVIKKLYSSVVIEASEAGQSLDEGKSSLMEISLVPERSLSNVLDKVFVSQRVSVAELPMRIGASIVPLSRNLGNEFLAAKLEQSRNSEWPIFSAGAVLDKEVQKSDEIDPVCGKSKIIARVQHKEQCKQAEIEMMGSGLSKQRYQNFVRRKKLPKKPFVSKIKSLQNRGAKNDDYYSSRMACRTPESALKMGCEVLEKLPHIPDTDANTVASSSAQDSDTSKHNLVRDIFSKTKTLAVVADERSKAREKGEISQSSKSSIGEYSKSTTSYSEESCLSRSSHCGFRPHMSKEFRWEAISSVWKQHGSLGWRHFKLLRKIGSGDIAMVYLCELIGTNCLFAMKVMDKDSLVSRKKMAQAQTEKGILEILDHPFLPTLYAHFMTDKFSCLVMEYCPGGDLHAHQQNQPTKCFPEKAARFYAAEVLLALEYLHVLGVVYRDLRLENVLVREDGHVMLSDFDLSLRCTVKPRLMNFSSPVIEPPKRMPSSCSDSSCIDPFCLQPSRQLSCFTARFLSTAAKTCRLKSKSSTQVILLPQLVVEPTSTRSNSFVGTPEYLAPEIIKGEDHGSALDWWTFGIFLYELLFGRTPFKGSNDEDTLSNVVSQCLNFPQSPISSSRAQDLIRRLLIKDPENRLGSAKGAAEIKQHPFFEGLNWALIRHEIPPELPQFINSSTDNPHTVPQSSTSIMIPPEPEDPGDETEFEMF